MFELYVKPLRLRHATCYAAMTVCIIIVMHTYTSSLNIKVSLDERISDTIRQLAKSVNDVQINKSNNEFISIVNIIQADTNVALKESEHIDGPYITWCSQCSENHLHYIPLLAASWDGPVSIAVFSSGTRILHTLQYMSALHHCDANVKQRINFHLCIPSTDAGQFTVKHTDDAMQMVNISCNMLLENDNKSLINFDPERGLYPINILRNLAVTNAYTQHVLTVDIDFLPSENLTSKLNLFFKTDTIKPKTAFILPPFETNVSIKNVISRTALLDKWERGTVRPFHQKLCFRCHFQTDYNRWKLIHVGKKLSVAYYCDWKEFWEPYLITRKDEFPDFREEFKGYGYDRQSQITEMYMSGFRFAVLDDGFLIHDGFKSSSPEFAKSDMKLFYKLYYLFKQTLRKQYKNTGRKLN